MMKTGVKVILAAMGAAILASPVTAMTWGTMQVSPSPDVSTDNVFWGMPYGRPHAHAYGYAAHPPANRPAPSINYQNQPRFLDCVHVTVPQCSGGGG
jgi:hypothetical protein